MQNLTRGEPVPALADPTAVDSPKSSFRKPQYCPECQGGYHTECRVATGEWDAPGACTCDCVSEAYKTPSDFIFAAVICGWCRRVLEAGAPPTVYSMCATCENKHKSEAGL